MPTKLLLQKLQWKGTWLGTSRDSERLLDPALFSPGVQHSLPVIVCELLRMVMPLAKSLNDMARPEFQFKVSATWSHCWGWEKRKMETEFFIFSFSFSVCKFILGGIFN